MHRFEGGCHCGNISFVFETGAPLEVLGLRACQCSFCRAHGARNTSDPAGAIRLAMRDETRLVRYSFGLKTADFLLCGACGVYVGAVIADGARQWMTVNANAFKPPPPADFPLAANDFAAEDTAGRIARRKAKWTPVLTA